MKHTTIKDVAREAGVSITTVSHVLSGRGSLKQETRDRVMEVARSLNYFPDWNGRNLKSVQTNIIALFVQSIRGYYGQLADAMCEECRKRGYELDIIIADDGGIVMRNLMSRRMDGAVILHDGFSDENARILMDSELPTVFLDREIQGKYVSSVLLDSYQAGRQSAGYLYGLGHRRILFIEGKNTFDAIERYRGFSDFMNEQGTPLNPDYCIPGLFDRYAAHASVEKFLRKRLPMPDAVFAANDDSAFGCMTALNEAGISIPDQISVMGCDDIELSRWYMPPLTTVSTNIPKQGIEAARQVVRLIEKNGGEIVRIPGRIVERASCVGKCTN